MLKNKLLIAEDRTFIVSIILDGIIWFDSIVKKLPRTDIEGDVGSYGA